MYDCCLRRYVWSISTRCVMVCVLDRRYSRVLQREREHTRSLSHKDIEHETRRWLELLSDYGLRYSLSQREGKCRCDALSKKEQGTTVRVEHFSHDYCLVLPKPILICSELMNGNEEHLKDEDCWRYAD
ncbi:hypothetical protein Tco_1131803 [Tanacetum coccineum]|uniref:Uncharacterized protein n=1 Tax=Tanacetum coccineum TaxID=301880 RepID=A0ABQ5JCY5_9ASTR